MVDYLSFQPDWAGYQVSTKQGSGPMAIGVDLDGIKHILGLWIAKEEGASFWAHVCANLSNRGVKDVFIVCCDGL
ncbi:hypothetical protein HMPREF1281_01723, partial [Corynebacterium sp. KPL1855]